ncbi:MAG: M13 family metallopeptidase [Candidatus Acidiferrales bacterium]
MAWIFLAGAVAGVTVRSSSSMSRGFDLSDLDTTCKPCADFYQYATGGWRARNPVPPAYASWGQGNVIGDRNQEILHQILDAAAKDKHAAPGSVEQKIGDFYGSCMDEARIEAAGSSPLQPELERIARISSVADLEAETTRLQSIGVDAMFGFGSTQDFKDSTQVIGVAWQGGLGMPNRDYYLRPDPASQKMRDQYAAHVARMFVLLGDAPDAAAAEAKTVMTMETQLAQASSTPVELRDPAANYHRMTPPELQTLTTHFVWADYLRETGFPDIAAVNLGQPKFFQQLDQMLQDVPLVDWKTYLRWHLVHGAATLLSSNFVNENFDFYGRTLQGTTELRPRWRRCITATDHDLGEALGQKYVEKVFPPQAKAAALQMVHNLIATLRADMETLTWMGPETRKQAEAKLDAMTLKIGYPDKWRDYSTYQVTRDSYIENAFSGETFEFRRNLAQIGKPVDRNEWDITPPTVNAYYNLPMNEIVFPAGILQPPFFDPAADDALNYGSMGSIIGHEMTHGFDDQGSQFDAQGNLRDWWTPEDHKNFEARANCVARQFDAFVVDGDLHENGKLVEGESIADLGGLTISHIAFETAEAGKSTASIDGMTPDQRFYLSYAHSWAENSRPERERLLTNTDPHPLPRFRVIGPLSNLPEFASAYGCQAGDAMVRPGAERCRIW